jgi:hypothetical protein
LRLPDVVGDGHRVGVEVRRKSGRGGHQRSP